jgi:hypothetical protein
MLERWQKKLTFPATWATDGSKRRFFGFSIEQHAVDPSGNKSRGLEASLEAQSGPPTTARPGWLLVAFWTRLGESTGGKTVEHWSRVVLEGVAHADTVSSKRVICVERGRGSLWMGEITRAAAVGADRAQKP